MIYVGILVIPVLISEYEFQDAMQTHGALSPRPTGRSADDIRAPWRQKRRTKTSRCSRKTSMWRAKAGNVRISAAYSVTVDLQVYQWTLNFNPSASNDALGSVSRAIDVHFHSQSCARRLYFNRCSQFRSFGCSAKFGRLFPAGAVPKAGDSARQPARPQIRSIGCSTVPRSAPDGRLLEGHRVRVRINRGFLLSGLGLTLLGAFVALCCWLARESSPTTGHVYGRMIDEHLAGHVDQTTARIYAAPTRISVGQKLSASDLVSSLQLAGYGTAEVPGAPGWYAAKGDTIEIHPEADSYFAGKKCAAGAVRRPQHTEHAAAGRRLVPGPRGNRAGTADQPFRQLAREAPPRAL